MPDNVEPFFLFNPVDGEFHITSRFNTRRDYSPNGRHEGVDLRVRTRTGQLRNILAAQRGTVDRIRHRTTGLGIYVKIDHDWPDGNKYSTWYGHMSKVNPNLKVGQFVQAGDVLGVGGSTGNSTAPHLHLTLQHHGHGLSGYVLPDIINPTNMIRLNASHSAFDQMAFVEDVTAPDGMMIEAGKHFSKKWRVKNVGSTTWGDGYKMIHVDGDTMGGPYGFISHSGRQTRGRSGDFYPHEGSQSIGICPVSLATDEPTRSAIFVSDVCRGCRSATDIA